MSRIVKLSKNFVPACFIEKASLESKSTSKKYKTKKKNVFIHNDGLAEELKAKEYISRNYPHLVFKSQRLVTPFGEVDLIFYHQEKNQIFIYEVKKWNGITPPDQRITTKQILRLKKICFYLSEKYQKNISLELILVKKNEITQIPL